MSWNINGSYFETCSCNVVCPCTASLALGATLDRCKVTLVFHVRNGDVNGTDVAGLTVAAIVWRGRYLLFDGHRIRKL